MTAGRAPAWRRAAGVAVLALAFSVALAGAGGAVTVERVVSPKGIEAWLVSEPSIPIISMRFAFRGGAALDPQGKEGLAQLVSGLLDEGAGDMDARAFQTALDAQAIRLGFSAGRDEFAGNLDTLTENRDRAFALLALALGAPRFDADAVARVREQNLTALARSTKDPNQIARNLWYRTVFPDHPYGRPPDGTLDGMAAITADNLRRFVAERLARDVLVVGVAGNIEAAELGPLLDRTFGDLPARARPAAVPDTAPKARGAVLIERVPVPQSVVVFGQRGLPRDHPDYYAAHVMNHILGGGGFVSRLTEEIREKRGLAYGVYTYLLPLEHAALLAGGVATENARVAESLALVRQEFARMRADGVGAEELADAKTYLTGSFPLRLDSNREIANTLVGMQLAELGIDYLERRNDLIEAVTRADVARVARALLAPDALTVVVAGDPDGLEPSTGG